MLFLILGSFLFWLLAVTLRFKIDETETASVNSRGEQATNTQRSLTVYMQMLAVVGILNVLVILLTNGDYIFSITVIKVDSWAYFLIGVGLVVFKLLWSSAVLDMGLAILRSRQTTRMISANEQLQMSYSGMSAFAFDSNSSLSRLGAPLPRSSMLELNSSFKSSSETVEQAQSSEQMLMKVFAWQKEVAEVELAFRMLIALTNFVILPCLGVLAVSVDCYFNLWNPQAEVSSQYTYSECTKSSISLSGYVICTAYFPSTQATSYLPPFQYSFQCSSQIIVSYSSLFISSSIISSMVLPVVFALQNRFAPPMSSVERWLPMLPQWVLIKLSRPQSLIEKLQFEHAKIDVESSSVRNAALLVEVCRKHLGVSEFFTRWFRNVAVVLVMGKCSHTIPYHTIPYHTIPYHTIHTISS